MRKFLNIIALIKPYWGKALLNILFNILYVFFSLFSLAMIVPVLNLLFDQNEGQYTEMLKDPGELELTLSSGRAHFEHYLADIIINQPGGKLQALVFLCILIVVLFFFKNLFRYLSKFYLSPIRAGVVKDLRAMMHHKALMLPLSYFSEEKKGDIMSRMTSDVQEIEHSIMNSLEAIFRDPLNVIAFFIALLYMSPQLTLFVVILIPITGLLIGTVGKSLKRASRKTQRKMGQILSFIEETITGMRVIKAFNSEKRVQDKFDDANAQYERVMTKKYRKRDMASPLSEFLGVGVMAVVLWYGGRLVLMGEGTGLSASNFILYITLFSQLIPPAKSFTTSIYNVQRGMASYERLEQVLHAEESIKDAPKAEPINDLKEGIEYRDVSFAYENEYVLKNIDFKIPKGKSLALVGRSGSGKSTIADLLARFYDLKEGDILLDGRPIKNLKIKDLRNLMGIVTQEAILFNDTVQENIAFGKPNATEEEIVHAAKVANAHDFIMELENGYQTNIGDRGDKLSGGQKQRLTIARAILKNPPILILDEATSALDTESERLVQEALYKLMENRTSLVIAHRLSTIQHADEILVLENGAIVERGQHEELVEKNGVYRKLSQMQSFTG